MKIEYERCVETHKPPVLSDIEEGSCFMAISGSTVYLRLKTYGLHIFSNSPDILRTLTKSE